MGRRNFDVPVLVVGGLLSGALGLGLAVLLRLWADTGSDAGPTAATLNEAFSLLFGAAIGLALGTATVALAVRLGRRFASGLLAGLAGYVLVLVPAQIISAPTDVSTGDSLVTAALGAVLLLPAVLFGAVVGAAIAGDRRSTKLG